jgi:hypothetical protein
MKNKTWKKIGLNIFVTFQIVLLGLGSALPAFAAQTSWAALRYDLKDTEIPSAVKDEGEYDAVASYKKNDQTPKASITFTPADPKPGEKVTATAMAAPFANETKDLYYTWFLKKKKCALEKDGDTEANPFAVTSEEHADEHDGKNYPSHEDIVRENADAAECDVDLDGMVTVNDWKVEAMRLVTQNGFKPDLGGRYSTSDQFYAEETDGDGHQAWQGGADAERMPSHCYGYDATSGMMFEYIDQYLKSVPMCPNPNNFGGTSSTDAPEKIPAICGKDKSAEVTVDTEDPCFCGPDDIDSDGTLDSLGCPDCVDGGYVEAGTVMGLNPRARLSTLWPPIAGRTDPTMAYGGGITTDWTLPQAVIDNNNPADGNIQWWECLIDGGFGSYCDIPATGSDYPLHSDCRKYDSFGVCEKQSNSPYCGEIKSGADKGKFAALCGKDGNKDGVDDNANKGRAICPTKGYYQIGADDKFYDITLSHFNEHISGGLTYQDDYYLVSRDSKIDTYAELPVCNCTKAGTMMTPSRDDNNPQPYIGSSDAPLCEDGSPTIDNLLCGSLITNSGDLSEVNNLEQFHVFPQRLTDDNGNVNENYYELTRDYFDDHDSSKYKYKKGNNTGNDNFGKKDEEFWGTDPRNPSTARNGKSDEANVAGLGAESFTWTYTEGDEVGVAVEGTSNIGTKFPDSSRMIMWAFSKGGDPATNIEDKSSPDIACQPKYSGNYQFEDWVNHQHMPMGFQMPSFLDMPTGFMDFDRCIEKSTVPIIAGNGAEGAQPKMMEVELSANPAKPLNDENGEGQGDIVDILADVSGSDNSENDLKYSWKIQRWAKTEPSDDSNHLTVTPTQAEWESSTTICGAGATEACNLKNGDGGDLKKMDGLGLSELHFKLDILKDSDLYDKLFNSNGEGFLKVSLTVRENDDQSSPANSRVGLGDVVVKVTTNENKISIFRPTITNGKLSSPGTPFCTLGADRNPCLVTKNEVVGLSIEPEAKGETLTDFAWTLNDNPLDACDTTMSASCDDLKSTGVTFIPVVGKVGDSFTVSVKASSISGGTQGVTTDPEKDNDNLSTGKKVELSQVFKVVEPSITVVPQGEGVWRKKIGSFVDPTLAEGATGRLTDDFSESILETRAGNNMQFQLAYSPTYLNGIVSNETWQIDGSTVTTPEAPAGALGTVHNVSAVAVYSQTPEVYKMLKDKFGVSTMEMKNQTLSSSIQVEVNQDVPVTAMGSPLRFAANLLAKVPEQIVFLFRLLLSVALVIVFTGIIFAFFPETNYDRRRVG